MARTADDVLSRWWETVAGMCETLEQAGERSDIDLPSFKSQVLGIMLEAIKSGALQLADEPASSLQARARAVADRIAAYQRASVDVRLHLIRLSEDWKCSACGKNVVAAATLTRKTPPAAELVCKACSARTPLTTRGAERLQELFGALPAGWNPALHGFVTR